MIKTPTPLRQYLKCDRGVSAIEFGMIAPILFFLLMGSIEFGLFMNQQMKMENLSRSVTEYMRLGGDADNAWDDVIIASGLFANTSDLASVLTMNAQNICECDGADPVDCGTACPAGEYRRHFVDVRLEMNYTPIVNYFGFADDLVITGHTRLQTE